MAPAPDLKLRAVALRGGPELGGDLPGHFSQVNLLPLDLDHVGIQAREVEQVDGQLLESLDLSAHLGDELLSLGGARSLRLEQLDETAQGEDRRPQLVRGVCDELLAGAVETGEPPLHVVEAAGELSDLVRGVDRDRLV